MEEAHALAAFAALSQETRLRILRLLVVAGPKGLSAGVIADRIGVSASNLSFHVKELERAGLLASRRESRSIYYAARFEAITGLARFLMEDCCAGAPACHSPETAPCP